MFDFNHGAEALFLYGAFQHLEKEGEELDELEVDNEPRNMHPSTSFNDDLKGSDDFDDDDFYDEYSDEDDYEDDDFDDDDEIVDEF